MPWTEKDYPASWKNFDETTRRKAIDIANAMIKEGYEDDKVIPIATAQAKKWVEEAASTEIDSFKQKDITKHQNHHKSKGSEYVDRDVHVQFNNDLWEVKTEGAEQPSETFDTKKEAQERAKEIADNRGTNVISHKKNE